MNGYIMAVNVASDAMRDRMLIFLLAISWAANAAPVHQSSIVTSPRALIVRGRQQHGQEKPRHSDIRTVNHEKAPGESYQKGSPLYGEQQLHEDSGEEEPPPPVATHSSAEGAYSGYSPASEETTQFVILCFLIVVLIPPLILTCSSCYTAQTNRPVPSHRILSIMGEKRTMRLLILPTLACITTMTMTWLNYQWYSEELGLPLDETYYVSQVINFRRVEPWSAWIARWSIWFLVIFAAVEWKGEVLPWEVMWLPLTWGICLALTIASGVHQYDIRQSYEAPVWGIPGEIRLLIHVICAFFAFFVCWLETVFFWWPNRIVHGVYGFLVFGFIFPHKPEAVTIFMEWVILMAHFILVWWRAPIVDSQIQTGTWKPWIGCCGVCCPNLAADNSGTNWCPPAPPPSVDKFNLVGVPVGTAQ